MKAAWTARLAGAAAGLANGLFGGGGGMVFLPIQSRWGNLSQRKRGVSLTESLPYLAGGLIGGFFGGKLYGKISTKFLKWLFAAFLFYAGVKYLL